MEKDVIDPSWRPSTIIILVKKERQKDTKQCKRKESAKLKLKRRERSDPPLLPILI